jgi:transcriptional regulator with XRE-family HTH domain
MWRAILAIPDVRIQSNSPDDVVLRELGERLARTRLERNLSQERLGVEAGVSKRTIERLEAGEPVKSNSLIRVLRGLGQLDALDRLVPEPLPSPVERLRSQGRRRRRAGTPRSPGKGAPTEPWRWGDEPGDDSSPR